MSKDFEALTNEGKLSAINTQMARILSQLESENGNRQRIHSDYREQIKSLFEQSQNLVQRMIKVEMICSLMLFMSSITWIALIGMIVKMVFEKKP